MGRVDWAALAGAGLMIGFALGCGQDLAPATVEGAALSLAGCAGAPEGIDGFETLALLDPVERFSYRVFLAPAHPRPGQEVYAMIEQQAAAPITAYAHYTSDGWNRISDQALTIWCDLPSTNPNVPAFKLHGIRLGTFGDGTNVDVAFRIHFESTSYDDRWLSNGGANYRFEVRSPRPLAWLGASVLRIDGHALPGGLVPSGRALEVAVESYPMGAARTVNLFYRTGGESGSTRMQLAADRAGTYQANSQWVGTISGATFQADREVEYWIRAEDFEGRVLWDSRYGANHRVTPQRLTVGWAGGFGGYRPSARSYIEGYLMNADGSTAIGCENSGASLSSYVVRAIRVWAPGLTDRRFANEDEKQAAAQVLTAEVRTNASVRGWTSVPMSFVEQVGNDFVYTFFSFNQFCASGGDMSRGLPNGRYEYRFRFTTNGGQSWFERGQQDGPNGGGNLPLAWGVTCSYFGSPYACHPPSGTYYALEYTGGDPGMGAVVRFADVPVDGAAVTDSRILSNRSSGDLSVQPTLTGPDAAFFHFRMINPETGAAYSAGRAVQLAPGARIEIEVTYAPAEVTGSLPHLAELVWQYAPATPGSPPPAQESLLFLRGTAR